jgi:molybdopterin-biosynthesis enzyme MoeA-like protein
MVKEMQMGNRMLKSIWFSELDTMQQKHSKTNEYCKYMKTFQLDESRTWDVVVVILR